MLETKPLLPQKKSSKKLIWCKRISILLLFPILLLIFHFCFQKNNPNPKSHSSTSHLIQKRDEAQWDLIKANYQAEKEEKKQIYKFYKYVIDLHAKKLYQEGVDNEVGLLSKEYLYMKEEEFKLAEDTSYDEDKLALPYKFFYIENFTNRTFVEQYNSGKLDPSTKICTDKAYENARARYFEKLKNCEKVMKVYRRWEKCRASMYRRFRKCGAVLLEACMERVKGNEPDPQERKEPTKEDCFINYEFGHDGRPQVALSAQEFLREPDLEQSEEKAALDRKDAGDADPDQAEVRKRELREIFFPMETNKIAGSIWDEIYPICRSLYLRRREICWGWDRPGTICRKLVFLRFKNCLLKNKQLLSENNKIDKLAGFEGVFEVLEEFESKAPYGVMSFEHCNCWNSCRNLVIIKERIKRFLDLSALKEEEEKNKTHLKRVGWVKPRVFDTNVLSWEEKKKRCKCDCGKFDFVDYKEKKKIIKKKKKSVLKIDKGTEAQIINIRKMRAEKKRREREKREREEKEENERRDKEQKEEKKREEEIKKEKEEKRRREEKKKREKETKLEQEKRIKEQKEREERKKREEEQEEKERLEREKIEKEQREKTEKEQREKIEKEQKEKIEKEQKEMAKKRAAEKAQKEAEEKAKEQEKLKNQATKSKTLPNKISPIDCSKIFYKNLSTKKQIFNEECKSYLVPYNPKTSFSTDQNLISSCKIFCQTDHFQTRGNNQHLPNLKENIFSKELLKRKISINWKELGWNPDWEFLVDENDCNCSDYYSSNPEDFETENEAVMTPEEEKLSKNDIFKRENESASKKRAETHLLVWKKLSSIEKLQEKEKKCYPEVWQLCRANYLQLRCEGWGNLLNQCQKRTSRRLKACVIDNLALCSEGKKLDQDRGFETERSPFFEILEEKSELTEQNLSEEEKQYLESEYESETEEAYKNDQDKIWEIFLSKTKTRFSKVFFTKTHEICKSNFIQRINRACVGYGSELEKCKTAALKRFKKCLKGIYSQLQSGEKISLRNSFEKKILPSKLVAFNEDSIKFKEKELKISEAEKNFIFEKDDGYDQSTKDENEIKQKSVKFFVKGKIVRRCFNPVFKNCRGYHLRRLVDCRTIYGFVRKRCKTNAYRRLRRCIKTNYGNCLGGDEFDFNIGFGDLLTDKGKKKLKNRGQLDSSKESLADLGLKIEYYPLEETNEAAEEQSMNLDEISIAEAPFESEELPISVFWPLFDGNYGCCSQQQNFKRKNFVFCFPDCRKIFEPVFKLCFEFYKSSLNFCRSFAGGYEWRICRRRKYRGLRKCVREGLIKKQLEEKWGDKKEIIGYFDTEKNEKII